MIFQSLFVPQKNASQMAPRLRHGTKHDRTMQRIYLPCGGYNLPDRRQVQGSHIMASDEQHPAVQRTAPQNAKGNG